MQVGTAQKPFLTRFALVGMIVAAVAGGACFLVAALLPAAQGPAVLSAIKGLVTGLGLLLIAYPPCAVGAAIRARSAGSPYFEAGFIATAISLFGLACIGVALACIGLAAYDLFALLTAS
jgi:hypothetical protein